MVKDLYFVSKNEIARRKKAFLALSLSLFFGSILASILLNFPILYLFFALLGIVLITANLWLKKFFNKFLKTQIYLSKKYLKRRKDNFGEKFLVEEISKIKIKRTVKNNVREIYIYFKNSKNIFINGLDNFDDFVDKLSNIIDKKVKIKKTRELIDFDSIFFYPILGLILSFLTIYLLKLITNSSYQTIKIVSYILTTYIFLVGISLTISKPISKRY